MMLETDLFRGELPLGIDGDAARPPIATVRHPQRTAEERTALLRSDLLKDMACFRICVSPFTLQEGD